MSAGTSQNFDAAFFNKYATSEYYFSRGASGNVYGPIQWNDMQLAIKQIMFAAGKVTGELKKDFEVKKDILNLIEHEHLLRIHFVDLSQLPKSMSIVMEFAAGGSLHDALRSLGGSAQKLPIDVVTDWAKQIAEGMLYLHEKHIVHRDLKSSNILLMEPFDIREPHTKMTLKIADFDEVKDHNHTTTMSFVGTVAYMAPEVIVSQRFSKGSDVWSYGVVIWEMLTGDTPHKDLEPSTIIHKAITGELDSLKIEESFPLFLKQLISRCLEPIPFQRASFHDLVSILQAYEEPHRVCTVDAVGKLTRSFDGKCGPNSEQMRRPVCLSVDGNGNVLVVDEGNHRVLLLDSNLTFQREILSKKKHGLQYPSRIVLDESNGRILVVDNSRILIFQINE